jgi:hypothetical protein
MTYSDTLRSAADLIRTGGLARGQLKDGQGAHCVVAAILAVGASSNDGWSGLDTGCWERLDRLAGEMHPDRAHHEGGSPHTSRLVNFNNHPDTTAEDVITVLEKAAIALEERVS